MKLIGGVFSLGGVLAVIAGVFAFAFWLGGLSSSWGFWLPLVLISVGVPLFWAGNRLQGLTKWGRRAT